MRIEYAAEFGASAAAAYAVIADVERWPDWSDSMTSVRRLDGGPLAVGSRARVKQPKLPVVVWTVTELEPDRSFVWTAGALGNTSVAGHEITPVPGDPTRIHARLWIETRGPLSNLLARVNEKLYRRYVQWELAGWQRRSESTAAAHK